MAYGMPGFGPDGGAPVFSYNSQKQYISLYAGKGAVEAFRDRLGGASLGGGCIRRCAARRACPRPHGLTCDAGDRPGIS